MLAASPPDHSLAVRCPQLQAEPLLLLQAAVLLLFHVDSPAAGPCSGPLAGSVSPTIGGDACDCTENEPRRAQEVVVVLVGTRARGGGAPTEADRTALSRLDTTVHTGGVGGTAVTGGTERGGVGVGAPLTCRGAAASAYHRAKRSSEMGRPAMRSVSRVMPSSGAGGGGTTSALSACKSVAEGSCLQESDVLVAREAVGQG